MIMVQYPFMWLNGVASGQVKRTLQDCVSNCLAHTHGRLPASSGGFHQGGLNDSSACLQKDYDGGSSIEETAFFLAALESGDGVVGDLSHQQGADFHLDGTSKPLCVQNCVFPGVFGEYGNVSQGDGTHRVKTPRDPASGDTGAAIEEGIPMVVVHTQSVYQAHSAGKLRRQGRIIQQSGEIIVGLLDRQDRLSFDGDTGQ